jgi:hypothetical protein
MFTSADVSERTFCADGSRASDAAVRSAAREAVMWQRADHASPMSLLQHSRTMTSESVQSVSGDGNSGTRTTSSTAMAGRYRSGPVLIVRLP